MSDYEDDWMNPKPIKWEPRKRKYPRFIIERERRVQGPLTEWSEYESFETREARDAALEKLWHDHPAWHLRPVDQYHESQWIAIL